MQKRMRRYIVRDIYGKEPPELCEFDGSELRRTVLTEAEADAMEKKAAANNLDGGTPCD